MSAVPYLLILAGSYFAGGLPFGLLLGKLHGVDVRLAGSGNIGATNVGRLCGRPWGVFCFILDCLKGYLPVFIATQALAARYDLSSDACGILAAIGTVGGHVCSPYLKFKGGKGVATSAGAILALAPYSLLAGLAVWLVLALIWRYVSLASIGAAAGLPVSAIIINQCFPGHKLGTPVIFLLAFLGALAIFRHKANIQRLIQGTEPKIGQN